MRRNPGKFEIRLIKSQVRGSPADVDFVPGLEFRVAGNALTDCSRKIMLSIIVMTALMFLSPTRSYQLFNRFSRVFSSAFPRRINQQCSFRLLSSNKDGWVTRVLPDSEIDALNKALGIDKEIGAIKGPYAQDNISNNNNDNDNMILRKRTKSSTSLDPSLSSFSSMGGYLEMNPKVCSGCGSPFQTKNTSAPGYLTPEKYHDHEQIASIIAESQEVFKILDEAGFDRNDARAMEMLKEAGIENSINEILEKFDDEVHEKTLSNSHHSISKDNKQNKDMGRFGKEFSYNINKVVGESALNLINDINDEVKGSNIAPNQHNQQASGHGVKCPGVTDALHADLASQTIHYVVRSDALRFIYK